MSKVKNEWWFSRDNLRGFNWASVSGFDFHGKNGGTAFTDVIYVYVEAGIIRITGDEAVALHEQMKGKFKQL